MAPANEAEELLQPPGLQPSHDEMELSQTEMLNQQLLVNYFNYITREYDEKQSFFPPLRRNESQYGMNEEIANEEWEDGGHFSFTSLSTPTNGNDS